MAFPFGHDDAADVRPEPRSSTALDEAEMNIPVYDEHDELSVDSDDDQYFQVSIPTFSKGVTTFAYQLALHNRIKNGKLTRHGEWSMAVYKPTFIHDCLMQPGSLGALIGKVRVITTRRTCRGDAADSIDVSSNHPQDDTGLTARLPSLRAC